MKNKMMVLTTLVAAMATASVIAQDGSRPRRPGGPDGQPGEGRSRFHHRMMMPPPLVATLDANKDGTIDANEIASAATALKTLDKNNDEQLTRDELRPPLPDRPDGPGPGADGERPRHPRVDGERNGPPPGDRNGGESREFHRERMMPPHPPLVGALDANKDQTISADEIANASNALKTLDKNGDGQLTMEELRPERQPRPRDDNQ